MYSLIKYSNPASRERCPNCEKPREFTRFFDTETGELLPPEYGICNRVDKCGYKLTPFCKNGLGESYASVKFKTENTASSLILPKIRLEKKQVAKVYMPKEVLKSTIGRYEQNQFAKYLYKYKAQDSVNRCLTKYLVGTVQDGCVFWFVDSQKNIHAGQVKAFNQTCNTVSTGWIHSILKRKGLGGDWIEGYCEQDSKVGPLFGEHLLALPENEGKTICLVESPKNAIFCDMFLNQPNTLFLATYSLSAFTQERCAQIIGRKVLILPDLGAGTLAWKAYAQNILPPGSYAFLDIIEKNATTEDRQNGRDIADFIIAELQKQDAMDFDDLILHQSDISQYKH